MPGALFILIMLGLQRVICLPLCSPKHAQLDIIINCYFVIRIIITINHQLAGPAQQTVAFSGQVAQFYLFARFMIFLGDILNSLQS